MDWATVKADRRNDLLQTDMFMISDYPLNSQEKEELTSFRQLLRDLPQTYDTAEEAYENYPQMPSFVTEKSQ